MNKKQSKKGLRNSGLLLFLAPAILGAQITFTNPEGSALTYLTIHKDYSDTKAQGSPYLNDVFEFGGVYVNDSLQIKGELRYNAYKSEIEVSEDKDTYYSLLKRPYIKAKIGVDFFEMLPYKDDNNLDRIAYFNQKNNGNAVLLFKPEIKLRKGKVPDTSYDRYRPPTYIDVSSYYLKVGDDPARKIRLKKKDIVSALKAEKEQVVQYLKNNKLNLSKEQDVIRLLNYYNTL